MNFYSWRQFQVWRIAVGGFFFIHFARMIPYAAELFSGAGLFPKSGVGPFGAPTIFRVFDGVLFCQSFLVAAAALGLVLAAGYQRRLAGFLIWLALTQLCSKNFYYYELEFGFLGWLLLANTLIPESPGDDDKWAMPAVIYWGGWLVLALSYSVSGFAKFSSPAWVDGSAVQEMLCSNKSLLPLSLASAPWLQWPLKLSTWAILGLETMALPLVFFNKSRKLFWFAMVSMHIGIGVTTQLTELSIGVLIFYLFLWDRRFLLQPK